MPLTPMRVWQAMHGDGPAATEQGKDSRARPGLGGLRPSVARGRGVRVIPAEFDYQRVGSVDDAIAALGEGGEDAKLLAGGHSLIPLMKLRLAAPALLIDVGGIEELRGVEQRERRLAHRRAHHPRRRCRTARSWA